VAWLVKSCGIREVATGDISIELIFSKRGWKARVWESDATDRQKGGDIDNLVKAILDGAQKGGLFKNDRQVVILDARKSLFPGE
jgi:Holliday junction resolvase RusA-like endonuclease